MIKTLHELQNSQYYTTNKHKNTDRYNIEIGN